MVLPLLFALGGQLMAGMAGAGWLGAGLGAFAGNALGQGVENGFDDINWGAAALSGLGGGVASAAGGASMEAAKAAATAATPVANAATAAVPASTGIANAAQVFNPTTAIPGQVAQTGTGLAQAANQAVAANPLDFVNKFGDPNTYGWDNLSQSAGNLVNDYTKTGLMGAGATTAQMMANVPKIFKDNSEANKKAEQEKMKQDWTQASADAMRHEAKNSTFRYNNTPAAPGRNASPADVMAWMRSAGINRGYAEGGATPVGLGLASGISDFQGQRQQEVASQETRKMFDIAVMLVTGKLEPEDQQTAFQILSDAMGQEQAMQYLQQVKQSISKSGGPKVVAGQPSEQDNVMAQDAQTGEPIKLASGEGILPTGMVEAAGGGLEGMKNIVGAAAQGLPQIRDRAKRFMTEAHA